jgi:large subunit ribosomal protein L15
MLDQLGPNRGARRPRKRVGRGIGSGWGKTCGRGTKGAGARSGSKRRPWFEGGQIPLARRLPKRGFHNLFRVPRQVVNVKELARFDAGAELDAEALSKAGLVPRGDRPVKVLAEGDISVALKLRVDAISDSARKKVEAAGGSVELISPVKYAGKVKKS